MNIIICICLCLSLANWPADGAAFSSSFLVISLLFTWVTRKHSHFCFCRTKKAPKYILLNVISNAHLSWSPSYNSQHLLLLLMKLSGIIHTSDCNGVLLKMLLICGIPELSKIVVVAPLSSEVGVFSLSHQRQTANIH